MTKVVVYGATGHTGRFVVEELLRRGIPTIASGRDRHALETLAAKWERVEIEPAAVDDPAALSAAVKRGSAVVNCAGPFAITAGPLLAAADQARIPYVDVAAEIEANLSTFGTGVRTPAVPAMAFFGGLGDLLATAALAGSLSADRVDVAYGLTSWHPTPGTRRAGAVSHERRDGRRVRFAHGAIEYHDDPPAQQDWEFPEPLGPRRVITEFSMADIVTIPSHLDVPEVRTHMTTAAASDLADPNTPPPLAVDGQGRSDQTFAVDVRVRTGSLERRATAHGQDIYASSAPLAVEAITRLIAGEGRRAGVASAGAMFDAPELLAALPLQIELSSG